MGVAGAAREGQLVGGLPFQIAEPGFGAGDGRVVLEEVEGRLGQGAVDPGQERIVLAALIDRALVVVDSADRIEQRVVQQ